MRDSSEITIQKAIVHLIELDESSEKKAKVLTLSAGEIPVAGDVELTKFFAAYITKNLSDIVLLPESGHRCTAEALACRFG